ncbi:MAG: N-acetylmuramoyl-L-alanine amidase [Niabella sp.]
MFSNKTFTVWIFLIFTICSCVTTQPSRTNVLSKQPDTESQPGSGKIAHKTPKQTVFKKPEQINRQTRKEDENVSSAPQKVEPKPVYTPPPSTEERPAYRTPAYYKLITDSIQVVSAKPQYDKMVESFTNDLKGNPGKNNPAVNSAEWNATVNFSMRKPNFVILHHTAQNSAEQTLFTFSISRTGVSAHYVVGRDGVVHQMLNDYMRAWHAGNSKWGAVTDMNSCSLGIEIDNNGKESFSDAQINALIKLLQYLKKEYGIPQANFIAHSDIAPGRKSDPSEFFPWKKLADAGFSYWYDTYNMKTPPADFNALLALRVIGYDISNQKNAISSFKLHYIQNDTSPTLTDYDIKVLYNVYLNY